MKFCINFYDQFLKLFHSNLVIMRDASGHVTYVTGSHAVILEELAHSLHFTYDLSSLLKIKPWFKFCTIFESFYHSFEYVDDALTVTEGFFEQHSTKNKMSQLFSSKVFTKQLKTLFLDNKLIIKDSFLKI